MGSAAERLETRSRADVPDRRLAPEEVAAEGRRGRLAGASALGVVVLAIAAIVVSGRASRDVGGDGEVVRQLRGLEAGYGEHQIAVGLRVLGLLLTLHVALHLTRAVAARSDDAPVRAMRTLAVGAAVALAGSLSLGLLAMHEVAGTFAAGAAGTGEGAAEDLVRGDAGMRISAAVEIVAHVIGGVWLSLLCIWTMRVGLLPRFLAVWGIGAGVGGVLLPVGDALVLAWIGSVGILLLGAWPDGRPPAWEEGRAVPWAEVDLRRPDARHR